jgi:hypothetical protein
VHFSHQPFVLFAEIAELAPSLITYGLQYVAEVLERLYLCGRRRSHGQTDIYLLFSFSFFSVHFSELLLLLLLLPFHRCLRSAARLVRQFGFPEKQKRKISFVVVLPASLFSLPLLSIMRWTEEEKRKTLPNVRLTVQLSRIP